MKWSSSNEVIRVVLVVQVIEMWIKSNSPSRFLSQYLSGEGWGGGVGWIILAGVVTGAELGKRLNPQCQDVQNLIIFNIS